MAEGGGAAGLTGPWPLPPPDATVGWRYWQVPEAAAPVLRSVSHRWSEWPPGTVLRAVCAGGGHAAPATGCACGIYGTVDLDTLRDHGLCLRPSPVVVGEVWLWGRVVREGRELRAEYGAPRRLWVVTETVDGSERSDLVRRLERVYGVPVGEMAVEAALGEVSALLLANQRMAWEAASSPVGEDPGTSASMSS